MYMNKYWVYNSSFERVKEMYTGSRMSCVKVEGEYSGWLEQRNGLHEGSALLPIFFMMVMDKIMKKVVKRIGDKNIKAIMFADLIIFGHKEEGMQDQLNTWEEIVREYNIKSNIKKCEYKTWEVGKSY